VIIVSPTGSYQISLPDDVLQQLDEQVSSFWRPNGDVCLQLSSKIREGDGQVGADQRLKERTQSSKGEWFPLTEFVPRWTKDCAAAALLKSDGWTWKHIYLVWPNLAIYVTISKPPYENPGADQWAIEAAKNIQRRLQ
jgi:hypothetical protein